jgi:predicted RNA-binding Zn ribbon-like protein
MTEGRRRGDNGGKTTVGADTQHDDEATPRDAPDDGFFFVGQALALDLVNTEVVVRGRPRDLLATADDVPRWWQAAQRHHPQLPLVAVQGDAAPDVVATHVALTTLRGALRRLFSQLADGAQPAAADLAVLNAVLEQASPVAHSDEHGHVHSVYRVAASPVHPLVITVALAALQLLTTSDMERLHRCGNERCVLLFYDTTKSATRRWCSLGCMDRARSARRYQEAKQAKHR